MPVMMITQVHGGSTSWSELSSGTGSSTLGVEFLASSVGGATARW